MDTDAAVEAVDAAELVSSYLYGKLELGTVSSSVGVVRTLVGSRLLIKQKILAISMFPKNESQSRILWKDNANLNIPSVETRTENFLNQLQKRPNDEQSGSKNVPRIQHQH
jgi:hypothetical protein